MGLRRWTISVSLFSTCVIAAALFGCADDPASTPPPGCTVDRDCADGFRCVAGTCERVTSLVGEPCVRAAPVTFGAQT